MARKQPASPKLCPRCDAFFPSIASETCPQCFAPLTSISDQEAIRVAEFQLERLKDPTFVEQKTAEDEKFKEQSFGACLAVVAIGFLAIVVSLILISLATLHRHQREIELSHEVRSNLPTGQYLPAALDNLSRGAITTISEPGSTVVLLHAVYGGQLQVYVLPEQGMTDKTLATYRLVVSAVCQQTTPPLVSQEVHSNTAYYDIIASNGGLVGDAAQKLLKEIRGS